MATKTKSRKGAIERVVRTAVDVAENLGTAAIATAKATKAVLPKRRTTKSKATTRRKTTRRK